MSRPRRFQDARQRKNAGGELPRHRVGVDLVSCVRCGIPMRVEPHLPGQQPLLPPICDGCRWLEDELAAAAQDRLCPHGLPPAECNDCLVESDLAYDSDREARVFGR